MATFASNATGREENEGAFSYFGWRVVLAAHCGAMVSFGSLLVYTFGIFLKPLSAEFGWSREEVSRAFAIAAISVALASPLLGWALDRWPPRRILLSCFALFAAGILALSQLTNSLTQLYLTFCLLGLVGNGTTQMGYSGAVSSWFQHKRGLALSLVLAGVGLGSILHPVLAQWMIGRYGWRMAYLALGILVLVLGLPLTARWVKRKNDGLNRTENSKGNTVGEALRQREFWLLAGTLFLSSMTANGALTHLAAHLSDRGISAAEAALATGLLGVANLAGRLITGWMLDRYSGSRLSFWLLVLMAGGMTLLSRSDSLATASLAALLIGVGLGGEADVTPFLLSRHFGLRSFSTLYGLTWTVYAMAGAAGPVVFGRVFDTTGSYAGLLVFGAGLTLVAAAFMLWMRPYRVH